MCDETATAEDTDSRPAPGAGHSSLEALLTRLEASGESGAVGYEVLRRRLVGFFRLHFAWRADELADIALERLARRLHEGTEVDHVAAYALGIARHVAMETQAKEQRQRLAGAQWARAVADEASVESAPEHDPALLALAHCLNGLAAAESQFILAYYAQDGGAARISHRHQLAESLGLTENAARNRALRLRARLERCVERQLAAGRQDRPT